MAFSLKETVDLLNRVWYQLRDQQCNEMENYINQLHPVLSVLAPSIICCCTQYYLFWIKSIICCGIQHSLKRLKGGTVSQFKMYPGGTLPSFEMYTDGTLDFYYAHFLSLILIKQK